MAKSFTIDLYIENDRKPPTNTSYSYSLPIKINNVSEYEWAKDNQDFISNLPSNKYGVYLVFKEEKCIYVGETRMKGGFQKRFKIHHYLREFMVMASKVVLYEMDRKRSNERILLEKMKIMEFKPDLNRAEEREKSIKCSTDVLENIKDLTDRFLEMFEFYADHIKDSDKLAELDKRVAKKYRAIYALLEETGLPESDLTALCDNELIHTNFEPNVVDCNLCDGEFCNVCNSSGKLLVIEVGKCENCKGTYISESTKGYCEICKGTGLKKFKPFSEDYEVRFTQCATCLGTGITVDEETCPECQGAY